MVYTYTALVAVIILAQFGAGIAAFLLRGNLETSIDTNMVAAQQNYGKEGYEGVTGTWDWVQQELDCCGECTVQFCLNYQTKYVDLMCCSI